MPRNIAQLTGMIVTAVIVFGSDMDVFCALPLGLFAGALATLFATFAEYQAPTRQAAPIRIRH